MGSDEPALVLASRLGRAVPCFGEKILNYILIYSLALLLSPSFVALPSFARHAIVPFSLGSLVVASVL